MFSRVFTHAFIFLGFTHAIIVIGIFGIVGSNTTHVTSSNPYIIHTEKLRHTKRFFSTATYQKLPRNLKDWKFNNLIKQMLIWKSILWNEAKREYTLLQKFCSFFDNQNKSDHKPEMRSRGRKFCGKYIELTVSKTNDLWITEF